MQTAYSDTMTHAAKPLTRLHTAAALGAGLACALDAGPAHKLRAVLRAKPGDEIVLFNGRDGEWRAKLEQIGKSHAQALCLEQTRPQSPEPGPWLLFAPVKKDQTDMIVEKAVELGAERLTPVITNRTESRRVKNERLAQQIVDAAEQCERLTVPRLDEPIGLNDLVRDWPQERTLLVCAERRDAQPLPHAIADGKGPWAVLIGPEGGFKGSELDAVLKVPTSIAVGLGPRILRAETAALSALAVLQALSGGWTSRT